jgi:hypothetical protein
VFGRDKQDDEDPFAALKEGGTYQSAPTQTVSGIPGSAPLDAVPDPPGTAAPQTVAGIPGTVPGAIPASPPKVFARPGAGPIKAQPSPAPRRPKPRRGRSPAPLLLLLRLAIPLTVAIVVIAVVHSSTTVHVPNFSIGTTPGSGAGPGAGTGSGSGSASVSRPASYLSAKGLAAGLAHVRRLAPGSKLVLLRIDSTSLDATVTQGHGQAEEILLGPSGTLKESAGSAGSAGISFSQIHPAVPPRLIAEMGKRFHVPKSHINYLVAISFQGLPPSWGIYLKNDTNYQASLSGAGLHKNG